MTLLTGCCRLQVLRWGALVGGIFYGFSHQSTIRSKDRKAAAQHEWDRQTKLIEDAKIAYAEKTQPRQGDGGTFTLLGHSTWKPCVGESLPACKR
jgi:hypothetical protein